MKIKSFYIVGFAALTLLAFTTAALAGLDSRQNENGTLLGSPFPCDWRM